MRQIIDYFTFSTLDDICLALTENSQSALAFPPFGASNVAPIVEFRHFSKTNLEETEIVPSWLTLNRHLPLWKQLGRDESWFLPDDGSQGYANASYLSASGNHFTDFEMRAKRAARSAGFSDDVAGKLIAAISEMLSNILEHSDMPRSGYVVFESTPGKFEFVVGDHGIGALQSLKRNPDYSKLQDGGTAIELALREGVSRHQEKGHGFGFRPLLVGLANMCDFIRFRSDDHCREYTRHSSGEIAAQTLEKAPLKGFSCSCLVTT